MNCELRNRAAKVTPVKKTIRKYSDEFSSESHSLSAQKQHRRWDSKEDQLLQKYHEQYKGDWIKISKNIPNRNSSQCSQRWKRLHPEKVKTRSQWTKDEDQEVIRLVNLIGKNWKKVQLEMRNRTSKQIRERYINQLDPTINHSRFTEEEDLIIVESFNTIGPKWSEISKRLFGRPDNMVKNRFYSHIQRVYSSQLNNNHNQSSDYLDDDLEIEDNGERIYREVTLIDKQHEKMESEEINIKKDDEKQEEEHQMVENGGLNNNTLQTIQSRNEDNGTIQSSNMTDNPLYIGAYNRASINNTNNQDENMSRQGSIESNQNLFNQMNIRKTDFNSPFHKMADLSNYRPVTFMFEENEIESGEQFDKYYESNGQEFLEENQNKISKKLAFMSLQ